MASNASMQQYEPLRVPSNWSNEEKRFVAQLHEVLDDVYRRFGRLRFEDLGTAFQERIEDGEGNIVTITQTVDGLTTTVASIEGDISDVKQTAQGLEVAVSNLEGDVTTIQVTTAGIQAAVNNNRLVFSASGLEIKNSSGVTVFKQDNLTGNLTITGSITANSGKIGPLTISDLALTYGSQFSIDTTQGYARIKLGNLLLKYVNSSTAFGLIYGDEESPNFASSDVETYIGKRLRITPSAMPTQLQGTLMTYNRSTGQVGSGYKIAHGSVVINDSSAAGIYYGNAGFTTTPNIVATYSKTGANDSGARGAIKVYNKTASSATLIIAGTFPQYMDVDWIAIGQ